MIGLTNAMGESLWFWNLVELRHAGLLERRGSPRISMGDPSEFWKREDFLRLSGRNLMGLLPMFERRRRGW